MTRRNNLVRSLIGMIRELRSCKCKCYCGVKASIVSSAESGTIISAHVS